VICEHGFIPDNFEQSVTVPVVKDKMRDICSADNYRPISLSPVLLKILEYCILDKNKMLSYCRETALQGTLLLTESGRLELGDNISLTLYVCLQPL